MGANNYFKVARPGAKPRPADFFPFDGHDGPGAREAHAAALASALGCAGLVSAWRACAGVAGVRLVGHSAPARPTRPGHLPIPGDD